MGHLRGFLAAWLYKTMLEHREGSLNVPKTILIAVTIFFAFIVPGMAGRSRLELAFQSMNAWHSFQYLGLVWLINTMRLRARQLTNKFVARLSGAKGAKWFYAWNFGITLMLLVFVKSVVAWDPLHLQAEQYYYMLTLSPLLIHYYFDTFVFLTSVTDLVPLRRPARLRPSLPVTELRDRFAHGARIAVATLGQGRHRAVHRPRATPAGMRESGVCATSAPPAGAAGRAISKLPLTVVGGGTPDEAFVDDRAERVEIAARIDVAALLLLGRHVARASRAARPCW